MSGPSPVPLIPMPDWVSAAQAALSGASGGALSDVEVLQGIANAINPKAGTVNCGWNIDAVVARFTGADANATAPTDMDGSWDEIEQRHNTTLTWGGSFQDAFDAVRDGGPGTAAIVGMTYGGGGAHVVAMVNQNGTVAIVEGQDWGNANPREVIGDSNRANERYNGNGRTTVGFGLVGAGAPAP
ncbi:MAG: toxin glutamine deamidase domain-containing protein [Vicinamibacteria bacterium]